MKRLKGKNKSEAQKEAKLTGRPPPPPYGGGVPSKTKYARREELHGK
jgi:hypothetical protein